MGRALKPGSVKRGKIFTGARKSLGLSVIGEADAATRTSQRNCHNLALRLAIFNICSQRSTLGKIGPRKSGVIL